MTSEFTPLFLATDVVRQGPGGGVGDGGIRVHRVPRTDIRAWLRERRTEGLALDFKIHAALWAADKQAPPWERGL